MPAIPYGLLENDILAKVGAPIDNGLPPNLNDLVQLSIAISLKRIADALDYGDDDTNLAEIIAEGVNVISGKGVQAKLYNLVTDLAWHAGQSFERGKGVA